MRGSGRSLAVLVAAATVGGCRFDGPGAVGDRPADAAGDGVGIDAPPDALPIDGAPGSARKKRITIDPAQVTGDQPGFPVWISLTDPDLAARATATGVDIYFTLPDGTPLEHQRQRWTQSTGRLDAWVRVDLADTAPTLLDLRYGDPGPAHAPNPPVVFGPSFAAVWHLDDALVTSQVTDARSQRNGTAKGGLGTNDQVAAQLGDGIRFDGSSKRVEFANPFSGNGPHTISAWVDQKTVGGTCDSIVTTGSAMQNRSRWFHSFHTQDDQACVGFYQNDWFNPPNMDLEGDGWTLVHWVFQNGQSRLYRDGELVGTHQHQGGINTQGTEGYLGYAPGGWGTCGLNGTLDEVRLATVARDAGWIATEYANQKSPQTFYSVGPEEIVAP